MVTKLCQFHNVPPFCQFWKKILRFYGYGTTVEWTWWRHRNANSKDCPPTNFFSKLGPCYQILLKFLPPTLLAWSVPILVRYSRRSPRWWNLSKGFLRFESTKVAAEVNSMIVNWSLTQWSISGIGIARGTKGAIPPKIFGRHSHFALWEAFFQTK